MPVTSKRKPVTIIGGYLGSGKTTLVNHLLRHCGDVKIAILVNDFGDLPIDADLIESDDGNIISLSGGCVCCSYGSGLSSALMDVLTLDSRPDHIVIEASGVALPDAIASSITLIQELQLHGIIVLANADTIRTQASDRYVGDTIERQASNADILVLNKIDLLEEHEIVNTKTWVADKWPAARLVSVSHAAIPVSLILDTLPAAHLAHKAKVCGITEPDTDLNSGLRHDATLFTTFTLKINTGINVNELAQTLACDNFSLARAKGFAIDKQGICKLIQVVGSRSHVSDAPSTVTRSTAGNIVCIGITASIDVEELQLAASQIN